MAALPARIKFPDRFKRLSMMLGLLFAGIAISGCTAWATYPPIEGAAGISRPGLTPIPELMAEALWYAYERDGAQGDLVINLPESTPGHVYDRVIARLGTGRPMMTPGEPAYHVSAVRVRGVEGEVDVLRPRGTATELLTVSMDFSFGGPVVERARPWRFEVESPPPHFPALAETSTSPAEMAEGRDGFAGG